jgi:hypothetical protein
VLVNADSAATARRPPGFIRRTRRRSNEQDGDIVSNAQKAPEFRSCNSPPTAWTDQNRGLRLW